MTVRAVAAHRAVAVKRIAQLGAAAGVQTPEPLTGHASICVGDSEAVRVASRALLVARRQPLYDDLSGAAGTRGRLAARLNAVLQRGRFAAQVARELTGGRLRRVVNGAVVVAAIGDAATRGGAAHLRCGYETMTKNKAVFLVFPCRLRGRGAGDLSGPQNNRWTWQGLLETCECVPCEESLPTP